MHPLRKLRESGKPTAAQIGELLAEDAVFNSPLLVRPISGREVLRQSSHSQARHKDLAPIQPSSSWTSGRPSCAG